MDSGEEQGVAFYAKINAHDTLVRLLVFEAQRKDAQFAERCRNGLDRALGMLRADDYPSESDPLAVAIKAKSRTIVREILEAAENADAEMRMVLASVRPPTLRRRILNWFERG
jgi:hypothetical protein